MRYSRQDFLVKIKTMLDGDKRKYIALSYCQFPCFTRRNFETDSSILEIRFFRLENENGKH